MKTNITLTLEDCVEIIHGLQPRSIDLVVCDLPYGVSQHRWDSIIPLDRLWAALNHVCKPEANIVLFAVEPFTSRLIASNPRRLRYDLVWVKNKCTGHLNAHCRPLRQHEQLLVFRERGRGTFNPQKSVGHQPAHAVNKRRATRRGTYGPQRNGLSSGGARDRFPTSVLQFDKVNNDDPERRHPHQKPVPLLEYLIRTYSHPNETVLDLTMGSGATGIACVTTGRHFVGIERDSRYMDLAEGWIIPTAYGESAKLAFQNTLVPAP